MYEIKIEKIINNEIDLALYKDNKNCEIIKNEVTKMLLTIKNIEFKTVKVNYDGYIDFDIDIAEKSRMMGELGYRRRMFGRYLGKDFSEIVTKVKKDVMEEMENELSLWRKAKEIFKEMYKDTKNKPTRRAKASVLVNIYRDKLKVEY